MKFKEEIKRISSYGLEYVQCLKKVSQVRMCFRVYKWRKEIIEHNPLFHLPHYKQNPLNRLTCTTIYGWPTPMKDVLLLVQDWLQWKMVIKIDMCLCISTIFKFYLDFELSN